MLKLRLLTGPRAGRQLRVSDTKPVSIGRRKGRLRLHDSRVSKNHAEITYENDLWILRDLGSANGTFVNQTRVQGLAELEPGDFVQIGRVLIKIVRCDGIGMDTKPELSDELLSDDAKGIGSATIEPDQVDGDLDLESIFGGPEPSADNDDSDIFSAMNDPVVAEATVETPVDTSEAEVDAVPDPIEIDFDQPEDDDDSFFADLGEATDNTSGSEVSIGDDDLAGDEEEDDPFLSGIEEEHDDTSDQISLEDESGMGPRSAGTTLLSTVSHDDLVSDAGEASDEADADEDTPKVEDALPEVDALVSDAEEEDDDDAPALVGLHLAHAPPQQPDVIEQAEAEVEDRPEDDPDLDKAQALDDEIDSLEAELAEAEAVDESVAEEPVAVTDSDSLGLADEASEIDLDAVVGAFGESEEADDILEDDNESALPDEPVVEFTPEDVPVEHLAEFEEDLGTETEDPSDHETEVQLEIEADATGNDKDISDDLTEDDLASMLLGEDESGADDVIDEIEDAPVSTDDTDEPEPDALAGLEEALDDEAPSEDPSPFDIDAAFDELSQGLDDTSVSPAIVDEGEPVSSESAEDSSAAAPSEEPDPLVGSQLDVGFIQEALSKLESQESAADAETTADDEGTKAELKRAATTAAPTTPPPADPYLQNPPPGLNPSSVLPPDEPGHTRVPSSNKGKWVVTLLLFLGILGAGGWYISQNFDIQITGRDEAERTNTNNASVLPAQPRDDDTTAEQPWPVAPLQPSPIDPVTPVDTEPQPRQPDGPNPFGTGPSVIGSEAVEGLTRGSDDDRPLDEPRGPSNPDRAVPDTIRLPPSLPPVNPGTTSNPPTDANPPLIPGTAENDPDAPPARIVFLVDASGSLVDSLPQMLVWLGQALQTVEADEQFAVYFFKSGKPIAIKPEGMIAPTRELLNKINEDWLSPENAPVFPSGRSNPTLAITQALALNPTDLYLLSDNAFGMYQGDTTPDQALALVKKALGDSGVRVHGVQFFYRTDDSVLEALANETKGTFEFVRERVVPDADPIDLLEELGGE